MYEYFVTRVPCLFAGIQQFNCSNSTSISNINRKLTWRIYYLPCDRFCDMLLVTQSMTATTLNSVLLDHEFRNWIQRLIAWIWTRILMNIDHTLVTRWSHAGHTLTTNPVLVVELLSKLSSAVNIWRSTWQLVAREI